MSDEIEDFASDSQPSGGGGRRRRVVRKRRRSDQSGSGGASPRSPISPHSPIGGKKQSSSKERGVKKKKEAVARLDLNDKPKLNTVQVVWVIIAGTILFFSAGIILLDIFYGKEEEVVVDDSSPQGIVLEERQIELDTVPSNPETAQEKAILSIVDFEGESSAKEAEPKIFAEDVEIKIATGKVTQTELSQLQLIEEAYRSRLYDQVLEITGDEIQSRPTVAAMRYWKALAHRELGELQKAKELLTDELNRSEDTQSQILCLIELAKLAESGEGDQPAIEYYDRAMDIDSTEPYLLREFALFLRRSGSYQEGYYQTRREVMRVRANPEGQARLMMAAIQAGHFGPYQDQFDLRFKQESESPYDLLVAAARALSSESDAQQKGQAIQFAKEARSRLDAEVFKKLIEDPALVAIRNELIEKPIVEKVEKVEKLPPSLPREVLELELPEDLQPLAN
ncbi:MAG: hypothetical protein AAFY98_07030 [Verrucomicrobiota bacterium]